MSEKEERPKSYRFMRTFEIEEKEHPTEEMDEKALQAYIRELLGGKDSKPAETADSSA